MSLNKTINLVSKQHPYKQPGNINSYSPYNEGWNDACNILSDNVKKVIKKKNIVIIFFVILILILSGITWYQQGQLNNYISINQFNIDSLSAVCDSCLNTLSNYDEEMKYKDKIINMVYSSGYMKGTVDYKLFKEYLDTVRKYEIDTLMIEP